MDPPDASNHPLGGAELSPFGKFMEEANKGNLRPELLADLPGLSRGQLEEFLSLLSSDPELSAWHPFRLMLTGRGPGRPALNPVDRLFEAREVYREVRAATAKAGTIPAAIELVSNTRNQSVSLVWKLYGAGKVAALTAKK